MKQRQDRFIFYACILWFLTSMLAFNILWRILAEIILLIWQWKRPKSRAWISYHNEIYNLFFSFMCFWILDAMQHQVFFGFYKTILRSEYFLTGFSRNFTIFVIMSFVWLFDIFLKNRKLSSFLVYQFFFFLGLINFWVFEITKKYLTCSDFKLIKTAFLVRKEICPTPSQWLYFSICIIGCFVFDILLCYCRFEKENSAARSSLAITGLGILTIGWMLFHGNPLKLLQYQASSEYGLVVQLVISMNTYQKPSGIEDYRTWEEIENSREVEEQKEKEEEKLPNIIIIMNEAFCDLEIAEKENKNYIPFTRQMLKDYPSGIVYSSVWGNNTVSSEFEMLSGISTGLAVSGAEIYQDYMQENFPSIISVLNQKNYQTIGIHPFYEEGYHRDEAWRNLGFSEKYFLEDFNQEQKIRDYISDEECYRKIVEVYEKKTKAMCCFAVTMQNHAPYIGGKEEYIELSNHSDQALKELIDYFSKQKEEVYLLYFGDHQPMLDIEKSYQIPYFIWTNQPIDYAVPKETSMNYLGGILLETAGISTDTWFTYVKEVRREYPVITDIMLKTKTGDIKEKKEFKEELQKQNKAYEMLKQYEIWSYERIFRRRENESE